MELFAAYKVFCCCFGRAKNLVQRRWVGPISIKLETISIKLETVSVKLETISVVLGPMSGKLENISLNQL
jgi:hypothetical protein